MMQLLIFIYNNNGAEMQTCALLTRIQCKVSDAQVTVKACGPLVLGHSGDLLLFALFHCCVSVINFSTLSANKLRQLNKFGV